MLSLRASLDSLLDLPHVGVSSIGNKKVKQQTVKGRVEIFRPKEVGDPT